MSDGDEDGLLGAGAERVAEQRRARRRCRIHHGEALRRCQCVQEEPALAQPPRRHCAPVAAGKSSGIASSSNGLSDSSAVFSAACTGGTCMPPSRRRWKRSNGAAVRRSPRFFMAWRRKWHYFYSRRTPYALKAQNGFGIFCNGYSFARQCKQWLDHEMKWQQGI